MIYLRGKRYYYRKQLGGKDYRLSLHLEKGQEMLLSRAVAEAEARILAMHTGQAIQPRQITFAEYSEIFLDRHSHKKTAYNDRSQVKYLNEILGEKYLNMVTTDDAR